MRWDRLTCLAALALAAGCPRSSATDGGVQANPLTPTQAWLSGELPPEVNAGTPVKGGTLTVRVYVEPTGMNLLHDQYQDGWTRRMLEFIGLPWDPRCLDFHQTERAVITASRWQVRQKISTASVARLNGLCS